MLFTTKRICFTGEVGSENNLRRFLFFIFAQFILIVYILYYYIAIPKYGNLFISKLATHSFLYGILQKSRMKCFITVSIDVLLIDSQPNCISDVVISVFSGINHGTILQKLSMIYVSLFLPFAT